MTLSHKDTEKNVDFFFFFKKGGILLGGDLLHDLSLLAVGARAVLDDLGDAPPVHDLDRFQASAS